MLAEEFGVADARIRALSAHSFNTVFRVDSERHPAGRMVLRIGEPLRIHGPATETIEAGWLAALTRETSLRVPVPIDGPGGASTTVWTADDIGGPRVCSLFGWVDGRRLREHGTAAGYRAMGRVAALLHEHARTHDPVRAPVRFDRPVYFGETNLVASYESSDGSLFVEALDRVQQHLDALWRSPPHEPHLLHGDIGPHNTLVFRGSARPIDFQDLVSGFDLQDVAITVADLARTAPDAIEPFRAGYEAVRAWPLADPALQAALGAARSLNVMNLGLLLRRDGLDPFLSRHGEIVRRWMRGS